MNHDDFFQAEPESIELWSRDLLVGTLISMLVLSLVIGVLCLVTS